MVNTVSVFKRRAVPAYAGIACLVVLLLVAPVTWAQKKIIKWTDKDGVVHYGDVMPAQASGRGNAELNRQGVVVKKTKAFKKRDTARSKTYADQLRKDSALMASYSSIEEIDLAMQRNVTAEENLLTSLALRLKHARTTLDDALHLKAAKETRKLKPSQYLLDKIAATQAKINKTQAEITATQNNIAMVKQRFAAYKARYDELRPRNHSLAVIKVNTRNLSDLEEWKRKANETLSFYLEETVKYKRQGREIPRDIVLGIQQANREIARADQSIANIRASIRNSEETFTSK